MKKIQIIVPCYNEQDCVNLFYDEVCRATADMTNCEVSFLFVDDGSRDNTLKLLKELAEKHGDEKVKYISFSRNFGKESAIFAGLAKADADFVVLMDADLQHPPYLIKDMYKKITEEGYDCCGARRVSRKGEPKIRSFFSHKFYAVMKKIAGLDMVPGGSDYRMMTIQVAKAAISMQEKERFTKGILSWIGFNTYWLEYENVERVAGTTKWSFFGLVKYAVNGILSFATTPLRFAIYLGLVIDIGAVIYAISVFIAALNPNSARTGYATMVILLAFFSGIIILLLGVIGEYLSRIYLEVKNRPIFIEKDSNIRQVK
ncbi:MAG: glycosyltransferase family 2 protein [Oscillospiraceae bacterium]|nr:glycosyltransferase family 2 protein [Oscillospiraceae bacterium]